MTSERDKRMYFGHALSVLYKAHIREIPDGYPEWIIELKVSPEFSSGVGQENYIKAWEAVRAAVLGI